MVHPNLTVFTTQLTLGDVIRGRSLSPELINELSNVYYQTLDTRGKFNAINACVVLLAQHGENVMSLLESNLASQILDTSLIQPTATDTSKQDNSVLETTKAILSEYNDISVEKVNIICRTIPLDMREHFYKNNPKLLLEEQQPNWHKNNNLISHFEFFDERVLMAVLDTLFIVHFYKFGLSHGAVSDVSVE